MPCPYRHTDTTDTTDTQTHVQVAEVRVRTDRTNAQTSRQTRGHRVRLRTESGYRSQVESTEGTVQPSTLCPRESPTRDRPHLISRSLCYSGIRRRPRTRRTRQGRTGRGPRTWGRVEVRSTVAIPRVTFPDLLGIRPPVRPCLILSHTY